MRKRCQGAVWHQTKQELDNIPKIRKCEEWCEIFVKVREVGLNLEAAAAILKPSCSQATGPLESPCWPETDPAGLMRSDQAGGREQLKSTL